MQARRRRKVDGWRECLDTVTLSLLVGGALAICTALVIHGVERLRRPAVQQWHNVPVEWPHGYNELTFLNQLLWDLLLNGVAHRHHRPNLPELDPDHHASPKLDLVVLQLSHAANGADRHSLRLAWHSILAKQRSGARKRRLAVADRYTVSGVTAVWPVFVCGCLRANNSKQEELLKALYAEQQQHHDLLVVRSEDKYPGLKTLLAIQLLTHYNIQYVLVLAETVLPTRAFFSSMQYSVIGSHSPNISYIHIYKSQYCQSHSVGCPALFSAVVAKEIVATALQTVLLGKRYTSVSYSELLVSFSTTKVNITHSAVVMSQHFSCSSKLLSGSPSFLAFGQNSETMKLALPESPEKFLCFP